MTLPIANGLAGSAGHALPEDTVCDWNAGVQKPWMAEACHFPVLWIHAAQSLCGTLRALRVQIGHPADLSGTNLPGANLDVRSTVRRTNPRDGVSNPCRKGRSGAPRTTVCDWNDGLT
jgi:hypothetical protein